MPSSSPIVIPGSGAWHPALTGPVGQRPIVVIGGKGQHPAAADVVAAAERLSL